jgi:hypothetical protein
MPSCRRIGAVLLVVFAVLAGGASRATAAGAEQINRYRQTAMRLSVNLDLPPVVLFLAPSGVSDPMDPNARKFGTVPAIAAGWRLMGSSSARVRLTRASSSTTARERTRCATASRTPLTR